MESLLPQALQTYLMQRRDPVGLSVQHWYNFLTAGIFVNFRAGPAIVQNWTNRGKAIHSIASWKEVTCLSLTMEAPGLLMKRVNLMMSFALNQPGLNYTCSLQVHGVLRISSPAYAACERGDWHTVRRLLDKKQVSISDKTSYGNSLLHASKILNMLYYTKLIV
jgi:hypothetical protein